MFCHIFFEFFSKRLIISILITPESLYLLTPEGEFQIWEAQRDTNEKEKLRNWIIKNSDFSGKKMELCMETSVYK